MKPTSREDAQTACSGLAGQSTRRSRLLLLQLFVAISLAMAYFFMVRNFFSYGNSINATVFMAGSEKVYRLDQPIMGGHWNGRLSGLLLSGTLTDFSLKDNATHEAQVDHLANIFGLYHAVWLLLVFICIIFALRNSLFINFGIFAGMMYDFSPTSGPYFYPWDIPAMFFFTLAILFFERRKLWTMCAAICAGAFFKETTLACAVLLFFAVQWSWRKRILVFFGLLAAYLVGQKLLLAGLNLSEVHMRGPLSGATLMDNLAGNFKSLFAPTLNSVIFVNAGSLIAVLAFCWQKRFIPYMTVIVVFIAGLFLFGEPPGISEVRDFLEILPLTMILLNALITSYAAPAQSPAPESAPFGPLEEKSPLLVPVLGTVVALTASIASIQYYVLFEDLKPANQAQSQLGTFSYNTDRPSSIAAVCEWFRGEYTGAELKLAMALQREHRDSEAAAQYQRVLDVDTNSTYALNNLAIILATSSDASVRDGRRAVDLAESACQLSQYQNPILIYTLAASYAEAGRFNDAVAAGEKAQALAMAQGRQDVAKQNEPLLALYKSGRPFHQQPAPNMP